MFRKGLFTESTLKLWEKNHDLEHDLFFRNLLHLNIAVLPVPRSGDKKFFMPNALVCAPSDMKNYDFDVSDDSVLLCFECDYPPKGIFSSLLSYLINSVTD